MPHDPQRTRQSIVALQALREQAERGRDQALMQLEQARRALDRTEQQAAQLSGYRHETQQRWQAQFRSGAAITLVHCYHDFVSRLHGAEVHSASGVQSARARMEAAQADLRDAELRLASVERLIERREDALGHGLRQREQRQLDEAAARASLRLRSGDDAALAGAVGAGGAPLPDTTHEAAAAPAATPPRPVPAPGGLSPRPRPAA